MAFKEKLEALLSKEEEEKKRETIRLEEERKRREEEATGIRAEHRRLEEFARIELQPLLGIVNEAYLHGRGEIENSGLLEATGRRREMINKRYEVVSKCEYYIGLRLSWDCRRERGSGKGKSLELFLGDNRLVQIKGGGQHESDAVLVRVDDKNARQKLENGIYEILSTPRKAEWSYTEQQP